MLHTTLRRLVSISGRAILAIGLTSATVLALAPSAKAAPTASGGEMSVVVAPINDITYSETVVPSKATLEGGTAGGTLSAQNNSGTAWTITATSLNGSFLKIDADATAQGKLGYKVSATKVSASGTANASVVLPTTGTTGLLYTGTAAELGLVTVNVAIHTDALFSSVKAGTFKDTITYTIANGS